MRVAPRAGPAPSTPTFATRPRRCSCRRSRRPAESPPSQRLLRRRRSGSPPRHRHSARWRTRARPLLGTRASRPPSSRCRSRCGRSPASAKAGDGTATRRIEPRVRPWRTRKWSTAAGTPWSARRRAPTAWYRGPRSSCRARCGRRRGPMCRSIAWWRSSRAAPGRRASQPRLRPTLPRSHAKARHRAQAAPSRRPAAWALVRRSARCCRRSAASGPARCWPSTCPRRGSARSAAGATRSSSASSCPISVSPSRGSGCHRI